MLQSSPQPRGHRALARPQRTGSQSARAAQPAPRQKPTRLLRPAPAGPERRALAARLPKAGCGGGARSACLPREVPIPATVNLCRCAAAGRSSRSSSRRTGTPSSTKTRRPSSEKRAPPAASTQPAVATHCTGDAARSQVQWLRGCVCVCRECFCVSSVRKACTTSLVNIKKNILQRPFP
jgi:hypothetical protein